LATLSKLIKKLYSILVDGAVEVYQAAQPADVRWLVTDQLGTPRMITRATGRVGLEPGKVLSGGLTADKMTILNVGNVHTTIMSTGQIVVSRGSDILLKLQ
jgi:hypothetical protein